MRGIPKIEVTFSIDTNGIVSVSAKDLGTGKEQSITITASGNLSQEEIDRAIRDAQIYAEEDAAKKSLTALKNEAEQLVYEAVSMARKMKKEDRALLVEPVKRVKKALRHKDTNELRAATEALRDLMNNVRGSVPQDGPGADGFAAGSDPTAGYENSAEGDAIDAEFEVVD